MVISDGELITGISVVGSSVITGLGWIIKNLWSSRDAAQLQVVEMLKLAYTDAATRKELWANLTQSNADLSRTNGELARRIEATEKTVVELREVILRKNP